MHEHIRGLTALSWRLTDRARNRY